MLGNDFPDQLRLSASLVYLSIVFFALAFLSTFDAIDTTERPRYIPSRNALLLWRLLINKPLRTKEGVEISNPRIRGAATRFAEVVNTAIIGRDCTTTEKPGKRTDLQAVLSEHLVLFSLERIAFLEHPERGGARNPRTRFPVVQEPVSRSARPPCCYRSPFASLSPLST